jgi:ferric-dicitrate binding protein FerR (iron transport regulator)
MESAQKKVRSWCEECEAWHPRGEHIARGEPLVADTRPSANVELRADPRPETRPAPVAAPAPRRAGLVGVALFLCVILPIGVVAWAAAAYALLLLVPHIKGALP